MIIIQAAHSERTQTGLEQKLSATVLDTTVHAVGQHIEQFSVTHEEPLSMPYGSQSWFVYDVFDMADCNQLFIGVVSDTKWKMFC